MYEHGVYKHWEKSYRVGSENKGMMSLSLFLLLYDCCCDISNVPGTEPLFVDYTVIAIKCS